MVDSGATGRYTTTDPGNGALWTTVGFDASAWSLGMTPYGYGEVLVRFFTCLSLSLCINGKLTQSLSLSLYQLNTPSVSLSLSLSLSVDPPHSDRSVGNKDGHVDTHLLHPLGPLSRRNRRRQCRSHLLSLCRL